MKFIVWSRHVPEEGEPFDMIETTRTDPKVAKEDVGIITDILHRRAWIMDDVT